MPLITSSNKFQRTYLIQVQGQDGSIYTIGSEDATKPLLTLEFSVKRDVLASANTGNFRIRNLNSSIRTQIYHDYFDMANPKSLTVKAGYAGTPLSTIFNGTAQIVSSCREEGSVDFVTDIEGHDYTMVMSNSFSAWTIGDKDNPVDQAAVINRLISDLQINSQKYNLNLGIGLIGTFDQNRYTYTANDYTWNLLQIETQRGTYIDNGKVYCLPNDTYFPGDVTLVSSATGLLGTPKKFQSYLIVEMIFEPSLTPGQQVYLDTNLTPALNSLYNGTYKVTAVQHAGVISSTVSGKCKTIATLQLIGTPFLANFNTNLNPFVGAA